jgi:ubiquinone/menaquinone biosynthesis C-methylase UbiE
MQQWNEVFRREGAFFTSPQEDIPKIVRLFKWRGVKRVLDLGCGSGRHTVYLAKRGFSVWGIDIAPEGIRLTKEWLRQENQTARLKLGSIFERLPYRNRFFDAIVSTQTLHHATIEDIRRVIEEMERVLAPRGIIFVTVRKPLRTYGNVEFIAPRTYVPMDGIEKGLPHFIFDRSGIKKEFARFDIPKIWLDASKRHYCFVGCLKKAG